LFKFSVNNVWDLKTFLLTGLFCSFALGGYCQKFAVSNDQHNIIYIGLPNTIHVCVEGYKSSSVIVTSDSGIVTKNERDPEGRKYEGYYLNPIKPGHFSININIKTSKGIKHIGEYEFLAKAIPDPVAEIGGKSLGNISRSVLKAQIGIIADIHGFNICARFVVTSFSMIVMKKNGQIIDKDNVGSKFSDDIHSVFNSLEENETVLFTKITAKGPDGIERHLAPVELKIVK